MLDDYHLGPFNSCINNTWVIWIVLISDAKSCPSGLYESWLNKGPTLLLYHFSDGEKTSRKSVLLIFPL